MVLVVQFPQWAARFDVVAVEHYQVSYLVCWGLFSRWIGVPAHSLLCFPQPFPGLVVHGMHLVGIDLARSVEGFP